MTNTSVEIVVRNSENDLPNDASNISDITILKNLRTKNVNKLIVANLNINSISGKFDQLKCIRCI